MPVFVVLLLAVVAEVAVLVMVGNALGALVTILLLIAVSAVGVSLLRRQGTRTLTSLTDAVRNRRDPQPEMVDGTLIAIAAALILFPGFISDVAALFLLFPPTRAVVRKRLLRKAQARRMPHNIVDGEVVPDEEPRAPIVIESYRVDDDR